MATLITDAIDIPELIGYVRESAVIGSDSLATILPDQPVDDIEYELQNIDSPFLQVARFRAWDTAPPLGKRAGFAIIRGEIAPLGMSMTLNEKELARFLRLRAAQPAQAQLDIYDDALQCALAAQLRLEQARADLLLDGKVTINENGYNTEADFGVPGTHIVTAATAWTDTANAVPVTNLLAWEVVYRADNGGVNPAGWLMSDEVIGNLQNNSQVKTLWGREVNGSLPGMVPRERLADIFRIAGIKAPIVPFNGQLPDTAGTGATPTIPVRKIVAVKPGMGQTFHGTSPSAEMLVSQGRLERRDAAGIVAWSEEEIRPARVITTAETVALPVLRDPKGLFVATV
jgi:hypothetical protein